MSDVNSFLDNNAELRKNPFRVPEGYFDDLKKNLKADITKEPAKPARRIPLYRRMPMLYPAIGIAASVIVAVGAITVYLTTLSGDPSTTVDFCNLLDTDDMYKLVFTKM